MTTAVEPLNVCKLAGGDLGIYAAGERNDLALVRGTGDDAETMKLAHLLAAAPLLLAACQAAEDSGQLPPKGPTRKLVREAIAAAIYF